MLDMQKGSTRWLFVRCYMIHLFWQMFFASEHSTPGFKRLLWVFWLLQDLHNRGCSTNQYALMVLKFWTFEGPLPCELEVGMVDSVLWYLKQEKRNMSCCTGISRRFKKSIIGLYFASWHGVWAWLHSFLAIGGHGKPMDGGNIPLVCRQQAYLYSLSFSLRNPFLVDH